MFSNFGLQDLTNIFNMLGVMVAIIVYIINSIHSNRQRSIDNAMRYFEYHSKILSIDGYCRRNVKEMENGTYKRDLKDHKMEIKFSQFMSNCEKLALLQKAEGVSAPINAYMIGWFAKKIYPQLTDNEKEEPYWEIAVDFLREVKNGAEQLDKMKKEDRIKFLQINHFNSTLAIFKPFAILKRLTR